MTPVRPPALDPALAAETLAVGAAAGAQYLATLPSRRVAPLPQAVADAVAALGGVLPEEGADPREVVEDLARHGGPATVATAGGRFFGLVVGATTPAVLGARAVTTAWDQTVLDDVTSPIGGALERIALGWARELLGLPADAQATMVTGATMASFTCLAAARQALLARAGHDVSAHGLWGAPRLRVVASAESHVAVTKALALLGFGTADIERVPCDDQGRLRAEALPPLDERTIVCLQAGNVNSGAMDPIGAVCEVARQTGAWVHVDGAFGLWAAAAPRTRVLLAGAEHADSWVTDAHKWLNCAYDSGIAIVRDGVALHVAMATQAAYLNDGDALAPKDISPEFSRGARGVELWAALRALGRDGVAELVTRSCELAARFAAGLEDLGFEILNDVVINQVVATLPEPERLEPLVAAVRAEGECWFGPTVWQGRRAIRLSVCSYATTAEDVDRALAAIARARDAHAVG